MTALPDLIRSGAGSAWLFIPSAVLLGALHGLEPGHSKTMMAAFIVAVRGTVAQAVMLGLAATLSHTAVVWGIAMAGLYFGRTLDLETSEPYFQLASAALIIAIALWMAWRTWRETRQHHHHHDHDHDHQHVAHHGLDVGGGEAMDAHQRAHADDIQRRFADRNVTTGQIIAFGLTGGLIPCPAAITVLLLCLQLREFTLGAGLVLCFSIGLAITMVSAGVAAAWGLRHVQKRWSGFDAFARRAPYVSAALIVAVGLFVAVEALRAIA